MIYIKDKCGYSDVALLVDNIEYGELIDNWRKEMGITKRIRLKNYWDNPKIMAWQSKVRDILLSEKERLEAHQWHTENNNKLEIIENKISNYLENPHYFFDEVVDDILKKINKGEEFTNVVIKSLLLRSIKGNDYLIRENRFGIKNIKRDRRWYWWNKRYKKYGYKKIAKITDENLKTVESAIKSYENKLRV